MPLITLAVTVVLACFALGVLHLPPQELEGQMDAKGNSVTGTYDRIDDSFMGAVKVVFPTGAVYYGDFKEYRFNGEGVFEGKSVDETGTTVTWRYEGTFVDGRLEGEGSYSDDLGFYSGSFTNSLPSGQGVYTSHEGWNYTGEFQAGCMTGWGTVTLADGTSLSGRFEDGLQVSDK